MFFTLVLVEIFLNRKIVFIFDRVLSIIEVCSEWPVSNCVLGDLVDKIVSELIFGLSCICLYIHSSIIWCNVYITVRSGVHYVFVWSHIIRFDKKACKWVMLSFVHYLMPFVHYCREWYTKFVIVLIFICPLFAAICKLLYGLTYIMFFVLL